MNRTATAIIAAAALCAAAPVALSAPHARPAAVHPEDSDPEAPTCSTCEGVQMLDAGRTAQAKTIFERQAARGDVEAEVNLGWMYQHGRGVTIDYAKARALYFHAASAGDNGAMNQMGFLYQHGLGVPQNPTTAYCWYGFAIDNGYAPASKHIKELQAQGLPMPGPGACMVINHS